MLNCHVGVLDLATNKAEVYASFWSYVHALDYADRMDKSVSSGVGGRVLWLCDDTGKIKFYSDSDQNNFGKRWERYETATARDLCGVHPLSAWSDHGVKAGKAVVLGAIREAVEAVA